MEEKINKLKELFGTSEFDIYLKDILLNHEPIDEIEQIKREFPIEVVIILRDIIKEFNKDAHDLTAHKKEELD